MKNLFFIISTLAPIFCSAAPSWTYASNGRTPLSPSRAPLRVLITDFEAFGTETDNASRVMVNAMAKALKSSPNKLNVILDTVTLPVVYGKAEEGLYREVKAFAPDVILSFGQAPEGNFRLETQAENLDNTDFPDNDGVSRVNQVIVPRGPKTLPTLLPVKQLEAALLRAHFPVVISHSAGNFLCNHLFYQLMNLKPKYAGFIHVPQLPDDGSKTFEQWGQWGAGAIQTILKTVTARNFVRR